MAWTDLKAAVAAVVKTNGTQAITGELLQSTLSSIIDQVGANATFKGVATPATTPGTPDGPLFYIAYEKGIYANFNAINITEEDGLVIILYSSNWNKINIPLALKDELVQFRSDLNELEQEQIQGGVYDVSAHNDGAVFESISALLGSADLSTIIPTSVRRGGMSIRFVQSSDNKYVQFRYMGTETTGNPNPFLDIANWQGVINQPLAGCFDFVSSDGLAQLLNSSLKENTAIQCPTIGSGLTIVTANGYYSLRIPVYEGDVLKAVGVGGIKTRLWATLDAEGKVVRSREAGGNINSDPETVTIQSGEVEFIYNTSIFSDPDLRKSFARFDKISGAINKRAEELFRLSKYVDVLGRYTTTDVELTQHGAYTRYGAFNESEDWRSILVPCIMNDSFTFTNCRSGIAGTDGTPNVPAWATFDSSMNCIRRAETPMTTESGSITIQENEVYFSVNASASADATLNKLALESGLLKYILQSLLEAPFTPAYNIDDAVITNLKYIYGVRTGDVTREYAIRLYAEGLLRSGMPITFANGLTTCIQSYDTNDSQRQVNVTLPFSILDNIRNKTIKYIETYVGNLQNKQIHVLTIGDSYLGQNLKNLQGQNIGPWNFASWLKWFSMMDNERLGNINVNMIGRLNNYNKFITYKGTNYTIRSCSEGVGGRTAYCYLNSPISFKMGTAYEATVRLNSETAWYAFGLATQTPFDSTTAGRAFTEFSNTEENRMLLASTPFGRFKPDYGSNSDEYAKVAVLWNKLKEFSDFTGTGDYTGSSSQKETMTAWFNTKMDNPDNPFYNKDKARAYSGSHAWTNQSAFDLDLYLSRYRTMNDSGERLAEGDSNLGTLIDNITRTQYDVCMPTHIILELGTNDVNASLAIAKYGIDLLISEIQAWSNSVKVIWCLARNPGVWWNRYQNLFANTVGLSAFNTKFDLNEYYAGLYEGNSFSKNNQVHFCPTYNLQSVLGSPYCIQNIDLETEEPVIGNGSDTVHCSIVAHKTIGYQLYSLLTALVN